MASNNNASFSTSGKKRKQFSNENQNIPNVIVQQKTTPIEPSSPPASTSGRVDVTILPFFERISSVSSIERQQAILNFIDQLKKHQRKPRDQQQENPFSPELVYTLRRIIRGLVETSTETQRIGFSLALSQILFSFKEVSIDYILKFIEQDDETKRQESFRSLFTYIAIIRSGRVGSLEKNAVWGEESNNWINMFVSYFVDLSSNVSYSELCFENIFFITEHLSFKTFRDFVLFPVMPLMQSNIQDWSPEILDFCIFTIAHFKDYSNFDITMFSDQWKNKKSILHPDNLDLITIPLVKSARTHPRTHRIWNDIMLTSGSQSSVSFNFFLFWDAVVSNGLLINRGEYEHERQSLAFHLFEVYIEKLDPKDLPVIFSRQLLLCVVRNLVREESSLHSYAKHLCSTIVSISKKKPYLKATLAKLLTSQLNLYQFDKITNTTTIKDILSDLNYQGKLEYLEFLKKSYYDAQFVQVQNKPKKQITPQVFDKDENDDEFFVVDDYDVNAFKDQKDPHKRKVNSMRVWAIRSFLAITKSIFEKDLQPKSQDLYLDSLKFLFFNSYVNTLPETQNEETSEDPVVEELMRKGRSLQIELTTELRQVCSQSFLDAFSAIQNKANLCFELCLFKVSTFAKDLLESSRIQFVDPISDSFKKIWTKMYDLTTELQANESNTKILYTSGSKKKIVISRDQAFLRLFLNLSVYFFSYPSDMVHTIKSILSCYHFIREEDQTKSKKKEEEKMDIFVDALISILAKPQAMLRKVVIQTFENMTSHLSLITLSHILEISMGNTENMEVVTDNGPEPNREKEESGESENEDEDESESDDSDDSDSDDEDEDEDEDDPDDNLFSIMKDHHMASGNNNDEEEEENPTEEDMFKLDEKLNLVFKKQKDMSKGKTLAARTSQILSIRAIDLIDSFVRKETSSPFLFVLILPLLEAIKKMEDNEQNLVCVRKFSVIVTVICQTKDLPDSLIISEERVIRETIGKIFAMVKDHGAKGSQLIFHPLKTALFFLLNTLMKASDPSIRKNNNEMARANLYLIFKNFVLKRLPVDDKFFVEMILQFPSLVWRIAPFMIETANEKKDYSFKIRLFSLIEILFGRIRNIEVEPSSLQPVISAVLTVFNQVQSSFLENTLKNLAEIFLNILGICLDISVRTIADKKSLCKLWDVQNLEGKVEHLKTRSVRQLVQQRCTSVLKFIQEINNNASIQSKETETKKEDSEKSNKGKEALLEKKEEPPMKKKKGSEKNGKQETKQITPQKESNGDKPKEKNGVQKEEPQKDKKKTGENNGKVEQVKKENNGVEKIVKDETKQSLSNGGGNEKETEKGQKHKEKNQEGKVNSEKIEEKAETNGKNKHGQKKEKQENPEKPEIKKEEEEEKEKEVDRKTEDEKQTWKVKNTFGQPHTPPTNTNTHTDTNTDFNTKKHNLKGNETISKKSKKHKIVSN